MFKKRKVMVCKQLETFGVNLLDSCAFLRLQLVEDEVYNYLFADDLKFYRSGMILELLK